MNDKITKFSISIGAGIMMAVGTNIWVGIGFGLFTLGLSELVLETS